MQANFRDFEILLDKYNINYVYKVILRFGITVKRKRILLPINRIFPDVFSFLFQVFLVTYYMIIEAGLPCKNGFIFSDFVCDRTLVPINDP